MSGLILRLREIATALPSPENALPIAPVEPELVETWHDSTLELERGLEVVELPLELPTLKADPRG